MADEPQSIFTRDLLLDSLYPVIREFNDLARLDIDQMIVVIIGRLLIARAPLAEVMAMENASLFK
jgi:hypothetical protein